jgi:hypothetical protein
MGQSGAFSVSAFQSQHLSSQDLRAPSRGVESARGVGLRGLAHGLGELERRPELGGPAPPGRRGPRRPGVAVRAEGRGRRAATDRVVGTRARAGRNCRRRTRT